MHEYAWRFHAAVARSQPSANSLSKSVVDFSAYLSDSVAKDLRPALQAIRWCPVRTGA
jgi:hypothetical protein